MKKIDTVLFDLDGVLIDACEIHYNALNKALDNVCNFKLNREEHEKKYNALSTKTKLAFLVAEGRIREEQIQTIWEQKQHFTKESILSFIKEDVEKIKMLKTLKNKKINIGCVTNSIKETALLMLNCAGLYEYVDLLISNEDVKHQKPSPEGYQKAMSWFKTNINSCCIVEDSEKGYEAAVSSGCLNIKKVKDTQEVNENLFKDLII